MSKRLSPFGAEESSLPSVTRNDGGGEETLVGPHVEDGRGNRDASRTFRTWCSQLFLAGLKCRETDRDRYCLLEDDARSTDNVATSAFLRPRHGEEYITLVENKR